MNAAAHFSGTRRGLILAVGAIAILGACSVPPGDDASVETGEQAITTCRPSADPIALTWSHAGPVAGKHCIAVNEPADPDTWADNFLCTDQDVGLRWSYFKQIPGMHCVLVDEPAEPGSHAWGDNFLCAPTDLGLVWSHAGPVAGMACTAISEPADPHTWGDNFLCQPKRCACQPASAP